MSNVSAFLHAVELTELGQSPAELADSLEALATRRHDDHDSPALLTIAHDLRAPAAPVEPVTRRR